MYIITYAYDNDLDIWFLGDLFEDRKTLRMEVAAEVAKIIYMAPKTVAIRVVPGNHDYYSRKGHIWELFRDRVVVYDEPGVINLYPGVSIAVHPYPMEGYDKFKDFLANNEANYLFTHADMDVEKAGLVEHEIKVGATSIELYKRFGHVYSGHYHWRQTVNNFTYLGNPLQKDFGDEGQDKGFFVLDLESGQHEFIPLPAKFPRFKRLAVVDKKSWEAAISYRESRKNDYLHVVYDPSFGIPKEFDVTTEPVPVVEKLKQQIVLGPSRVEEIKGLDLDPVKSFINWKKQNGVFVPNGAYTFAKEILSEVKK